MVIRAEFQRTIHTEVPRAQVQGQMLALGVTSRQEVLRNFYPHAGLLKGLAISTEVREVSELEKNKSCFDCIYDNQLLTQAAFDLDRRRFLNAVFQALRPGGLFVLKTLILTRNYDPTESFESVELDENYILWGQTPAVEDVPGVVERNGRHFTARKKIAPVEMIRAELVNAGFRILQDEIEIPAGNNPGVLKMILVREVTTQTSHLRLA